VERVRVAKAVFKEIGITMNKMNAKVDGYLRKAKKWRLEMEKLRAIFLDRGLNEEFKWGKPCYSFQESNIVIILALKETCSVLFCKGALLKDAKGILIKPDENTQAARQLRFTDISEIVKLEPVLKSYIDEAITAEKAGLKVEFKKITEHKIPAELQKKLDQMPRLKIAFAALTPGRQRAYFIYISSAKQSKTRESRVEKCAPQILKGKGLADS
jgi:uncharacterized protein YdeI (YjbR/CyaY-like superfamily)